MLSHSLQILFVQDSHQETELLIHKIEEQGTIVVSKRVETAKEMSDALEEIDWDLVIAKEEIKAIEPKEAIRLLRKKDLDTPFVYISKNESETHHQKLLNEGANDFVSPHDLTRLVPTISREIYYANLQRKFRDYEKRNALNQKMADIGQFASNIAHDFNNIMTVILGNCEQVLETTQDPLKRKPLENIIKVSDKGSRMANQLLNYVRQKRNQPEATSINSTIEGLNLLLQQVLGKNVAFHLKLEKELPLIAIPADDIEQILINMATNSRDAMPEGGTFTIETQFIDFTASSLSADLPPGCYSALIFTDTGHGISKDIQEKIFEPFFTTKPAPRGTGLGLSIVKDIVKKNCGHIGLQSAPGEGACFKYYFPSIDSSF